MSATTQEFSVVGKSASRFNGSDKVRGRTLFTEDLTVPGMVHAKMKLSPYSHATILKIDTTKAEALPGVLGVITGKDALIPFNIAENCPTEHALANDKVRYFGEAVAAVAAVDKRTATEAVELIDVEYEELPVMLDPLKTMNQDEIRVQEEYENNIHCEGEQTFGDVAEAFKNSHLVLENSYFSNGTNCGFIEPHSAIADYNPDNGKLVLHSQLGVPFSAQRILAESLEMSKSNIRIIVPPIGGSFGGKTEPTPASVCACILSKKIGRPVKTTSTRKETFYINKSRHPAHVNIKMGFNEDGTITGIDLDEILDGGANSSWGMVVMWFSAALMQLPYKIPNTHFRGRRVYTNKPSCGAQRGFGGAQAKLPIESIIDEAAGKLGIGVAEIRLRNAVETGYKTKSVVEVPHSEFKKCLTTVRDMSGVDEKHGNLPYGRGISMSAGHYSTGGAYLLFNSYRPHTTANIRVDAESGITVYSGVVDVGQGLNTVARQMAAEVFGLTVNDVNLVFQDTMLTPFDAGTYDSRVTFAIGHAIKNAGLIARKKLTDFVAAGMRLGQQHMECKNGQIYCRENPKKTIDFFKAVDMYYGSVGSLFATGEYTPPQPRGDYAGKLVGPSPAFGFTAQAVELEVDQDTGHINIIDYWEAGDCGKAINPQSVEGQIEGGLSMGIGQSLFEHMTFDEKGALLNDTFHTYCIPSFKDMPEIHGVIVDSYDPNSAFGSKEIGEGPLVAVPALFLNAVSDAIGVRMTQLPLTPEVMLKAMGKI